MTRKSSLVGRNLQQIRTPEGAHLLQIVGVKIKYEKKIEYFLKIYFKRTFIYILISENMLFENIVVQY